MSTNDPVSQAPGAAHGVTLESLILAAKNHRASDLHLEPGLPATLRVSSGLVGHGEPMSYQDILAMAQKLAGDKHWPAFLRQGSMDLSRTIEGVRCRINIFRTSRGVGMAIRLLAALVPTIETLNLHPDLKQLATLAHGLVLVSGATGSGKSSTLAALVQEINQNTARHIITLEAPIEYEFHSRHSFIRQREVGRDSPSMQQALVDALREDPDVIMVGEMRDPETMRLTLNAAETGHLVFATIHSATVTEALERVIAAFPADIQNSVTAQLADSFGAVVSQHLRFHDKLGVRLPECEILRSTMAVKNLIRTGNFKQIASAMETGAATGMWTIARYREWMDSRTDWHR